MDIQENLTQESFEKLYVKNAPAWSLERDQNGGYKYHATQSAFLLFEQQQVEIDLLKNELAKAQVPEGFVLVPESKISHFWQDNDEPENLCIDASGFNSLGDCIDDGEVMIVNKFTQANISKQKMFGVWCTCEPKPFTRFIKEFKLFDTQEEAEQAMIEAREQSHD